MTRTYTPVEMVRLNLTDLDPEKQLFTDEQLEAWLQQDEQSVNRTTSRAIRTIALSELLLSKVIRTADLSTDGRAVADALLRTAERYRMDAEDEEAEREGSGITFINFGKDRRRETEEYRRW